MAGRFIDVFAGCGGLSLGLLEAGWQGIFAIEKSPLAFATLKHNLVDNKDPSRADKTFDWPEWLPVSDMTCSDLLDGYEEHLRALRGQVDLVVGGPPCQGFSTAGRRDPADPRNQLTEQYLKLVGLVQPRFLVIENVSGFDIPFGKAGETETFDGTIQLSEQSYASYVKSRLESMGYHVSGGLVNCSWFGVPQARFRYLMICERMEHDVVPSTNYVIELLRGREAFLREKNLPVEGIVSATDAISDLEIDGRELVESSDSPEPGYKEAKYVQPEIMSAYQALMRSGVEHMTPTSRRLTKHRPTTVEKFRRIQAHCRPGRCLSPEERAVIGTSKHSITVLHPDLLAPTVTTLPDDILHYSEPRILTVRENARLQSFPDWFEFQGKYTTGGKQRKKECPRYTQVGNAVPPLLAEAIGHMLQEQLDNERDQPADINHELAEEGQ